MFRYHGIEIGCHCYIDYIKSIVIKKLCCDKS